MGVGILHRCRVPTCNDSLDVQVEQRRGLGGFEAAQAHANKHGGGEANRAPGHAVGASPRAPAFGDVAGRDLLSALEEVKPLGLEFRV
jgi:hypothetical protein